MYAGLRTPGSAYTVDDIRVGANALSVECGVWLGSAEYNYLIHKPREASAPREKAQGAKLGNRSNPAEAAAMGRRVQSAEAEAFAVNVLPIIESCGRQVSGISVALRQS